MKNKLMNLVKYNRLFYKIYSEVMKMFLFVLKLLITPNPHLILFSSFGGKKFDDSPKEIYSLIKTDDRFRNYELVWAFHEPHKFEIAKENKIKTDALKYYITALQARCWITNSAIERGVCFKGKNTFYFNTWHGTPIKIMGSDLDGKNKSFKMKNTNIDAMLAQGKYDIDIYSRVFRISRDQFCVFGLPRNDRLCNYTQNEKRLIKESLGIPSDKKVILYAPTYREYTRDLFNACYLAPPIDFSQLEKDLGEEYVLLFRAHYEIVRVVNVMDNRFLKNVSNYSCLNDLMIASDLLISDYSSIFFDYSIMEKPMICFAYDYNEYAQNRGMYFDIRKKLASVTNQNDLVRLIKELPSEQNKDQVISFKKEFVEEYGHAVEKTVDFIYDNIRR